MAPTRQVRAHWGLLYVVPWSVILPTALIALTRGADMLAFLALLIAAGPFYFLAANAIVNRCGTCEAGPPAPGPAPVRFLDERTHSSLESEGAGLETQVLRTTA